MREPTEVQKIILIGLGYLEAKRLTAGAEGVAFSAGDQIVKLWTSGAYFESSFDVWEASTKDQVLSTAMVKIDSLGRLEHSAYAAWTVVEKIIPLSSTELPGGLNDAFAAAKRGFLSRAIMLAGDDARLIRALWRVSRHHGYRLQDVFRSPQVGRARSGRLLLYDLV